MIGKTGTQIQGDVLKLLKGSPLDMYTNGGLYREGIRPRDSRMEDIVVVYTYGSGAQTQTGIVTILVFVPDIGPFADGVSVMDSARCEEIEVLAARTLEECFAANRSEYLFSLYETIASIHDEDTNESFVSIKLQYKRINPSL